MPKPIKSKMKAKPIAAENGAITVSVPVLPLAELRPKLPPDHPIPGDPYTRSTMAAMSYTAHDVARVFKDNPSSQWVITPYEIVERNEFMGRFKQPAKAA